MSRDLNLLHSAFRPKVDAFIAAVQAAGIDMLVTCGWRSNDEQTALYAQGRTAPGHIVTNAKAGQSAHNYGLAVDVVPLINGKCCWDDKDPTWQQIGAIGQSCGMVWYGAPGAVLPETPHFQMPDWENFK